MNINSRLSLSTYNPSTAKSVTHQEQDQKGFSLETPGNTKNTSDPVSISAAGAEMSDAMDPPVPVGAMPGWSGEFAIQVITRPDGTSMFMDGKFSNLSSGERDEYFNLLQSHMDALYERNGLVDEESTYAALNSRSMNEKLHQEFLEGIRNDPKMAEYVSRLGIALS
ncbi:hypothetical protein [Pseudomonas sp. COR18]|uniref:hypothetical protein n=1 Tax=Pseudomonas sp. COR18 TaxID=3399680 RepID=UPI003B001D5B